MARNEEKAQSMLYRFREAMAVESGLLIPRGAVRPTSIMAVNTIREAEHWRQQVYREISKKVAKIQNPSLNDYEVRELNDEINELFKEKGRWEFRIKQLGGKNYMQASRLVDNQGKEIAGTKSYKYFGRAKELPGVKELLAGKASVDEHKPVKMEPRSLGLQYYGYDAESEQPELLGIEAETEQELLKAALAQWHASQASLAERENAFSSPAGPSLEDADLETPTAVPTQVEIEAYLLQRKQQEYKSATSL